MSCQRLWVTKMLTLDAGANEGGSPYIRGFGSGSSFIFPTRHVLSIQLSKPTAINLYTILKCHTILTPQLPAILPIENALGAGLENGDREPGAAPATARMIERAVSPTAVPAALFGENTPTVAEIYLLHGPGYNPHGGAYDWSASNSSDEFYRPTRIPQNSFRHWEHQQRYDDWSGNSSDRSDYRRCHLIRGGYEDSTDDEMDLDHRGGHPTTRSRDERPGPFRRRWSPHRDEVVTQARDDDRHRRRVSRGFYNSRRGFDADDEDSPGPSGAPETPHQRREGLRNSEWEREFRSMGPLFTYVAFNDGLDERRREAAMRDARLLRYRSVSMDGRLPLRGQIY
ncbi:hypothetical protein H2200_010883 [Cladophialophora chaetospira]|uniref:Uncharacterized protein n=1 Tax=Cladophialophora chaetospira TaxID=386627 RepID=A0AA38X0Y4_9EURO|nr:hypothetical protein H2200_010883 [Cladophialophora chaetospira]